MSQDVMIPCANRCGSYIAPTAANADLDSGPRICHTCRALKNAFIEVPNAIR